MLEMIKYNKLLGKLTRDKIQEKNWVEYKFNNYIMFIIIKYGIAIIKNNRVCYYEYICNHIYYTSFLINI